MLDLIIKGGTVVAPGGAALADVGIQGERIAAVATPGALDDIGAGDTIDATGMIVLPGGIEPHAHINVPVPGLLGWRRHGRVHPAARGRQPRRRLRGRHDLRGLRRARCR